MTDLSAFDIGLAILILGIGASTIAARKAFTAVIAFVVYGLLLAIVWVRLVRHRRGADGGGDRRWNDRRVVARCGSTPATCKRATTPGPVCWPVLRRRSTVASVAAVLASRRCAAPSRYCSNARAGGDGESGADRPRAIRSPACCSSFARSTLCWKRSCLFWPLIGVWSLAPDRLWGGIPGLRVYAQPSSTLTFLAQLLPPVGVVVAIYMLLGRCERAGRRFSGRHDSGRDVAPCHDRGPEACTFDRPATGYGCCSSSDR